MVIEDKFILRYPILDYFYVNKNDTALAARIERGLIAIIDNGTLKKGGPKDAPTTENNNKTVPVDDRYDKS